MRAVAAKGLIGYVLVDKSRAVIGTRSSRKPERFARVLSMCEAARLLSLLKITCCYHLPKKRSARSAVLCGEWQERIRPLDPGEIVTAELSAD